MSDLDARRAAVARGVAGEDCVARDLRDTGWTVLDRNCAIGGAELDLVSIRDGEIQFVEVKARAPGDMVGIETIHRNKRRRLTRGAEAWLGTFDGPYTCVSFAVAMVEGDTITWVRDAFDAEY
jgi:putative endonuclease